jgi:hypothetical protein
MNDNDTYTIPPLADGTPDWARVNAFLAKIPELEAQIRAAAADARDRAMDAQQIAKWNEFGVTDERPS